MSSAFSYGGKNNIFKTIKAFIFPKTPSNKLPELGTKFIQMMYNKNAMLFSIGSNDPITYSILRRKYIAKFNNRNCITPKIETKNVLGFE